MTRERRRYVRIANGKVTHIAAMVSEYRVKSAGSDHRLVEGYFVRLECAHRLLVTRPLTRRGKLPVCKRCLRAVRS